VSCLALALAMSGLVYPFLVLLPCPPVVSLSRIVGGLCCVSPCLVLSLVLCSNVLSCPALLCVVLCCVVLTYLLLLSLLFSHFHLVFDLRLVLSLELMIKFMIDTASLIYQLQGHWWLGWSAPNTIPHRRKNARRARQIKERPT
jgi:hypothetical protein